MTQQDYSLAELMTVAAAEAFRGNGEVLATGIGLLPRLAASLAMKTFTPELMMTDSQSWMLSEPNNVSGRAVSDRQAQESWMGFSRIFRQCLEWQAPRYGRPYSDRCLWPDQYFRPRQ